MKNFNIFGAPPNIEGGLPEKRGGAWTVSRFEGGLGKKERLVFLKGGRVDTPMHTMLQLYPRLPREK